MRSDTGPDGLRRKLNEQGQQGYRTDLLWREGNDLVALMSRPIGGAQAPHQYVVEAGAMSSLRFLSRLCLADFPYLNRRLFVADAAVPASNDVVEKVLPTLGGVAYVDAGQMGPVGDHISRNQGYSVAYAHIRRDSNGKFLLSTVITQRNE